MEFSKSGADNSGIRGELRRIVSDVIGTELSEADDDVYLLDIVTSSLALVEGMRRVFEQFGVLVSFRHVVEGEATLRGLAFFIQQALSDSGGAGKSGPRIEKREPAMAAESRREIPISPSQQHVAFLARYSPGASSAFNEPLVVGLEGSLDGLALQAAVETVGQRYEALRTALGRDADTLTISPGSPVPLNVSASERGSLDQRIREIVRRPFEIGDLLFRAELLRLSPREHVLVLVAHNLVMDQRALWVVLTEIAAFYRAASRNELFEAGPPATQWTEYQGQRMAETGGETTAEVRAYWLDSLSRNVPRLNLPSDLPRPAIKLYAGQRFQMGFPAGLASRLHQWAEQNGTTAADVLFGAMAAFLHRLTGQQELVLGVEHPSGLVAASDQAVARAEEMHPVLCAYDASHSFADHIHAVTDTLATARAHGKISLAELIQLANVPRDQSRSPLFSAAFRSQLVGGLPDFGSLPIALLPAPSPGARYDIEIILASFEDQLGLICDFSTELFTQDTIERWLTGLFSLLQAGLDEPISPVGALPVMSGEERHKLLIDWNATDLPFPQDKTVLDLIEERIGSHPDRVAVRAGEERLSYSQLGERIEALAGLLSAEGIERGDRVGILLPRSLELIPALLATWRAGALYVPLDPGFPRQRIGHMLADADVKLVLTTSRLLPLLESDSSYETYCLDAARDREIPAASEAARGGASDDAYIIYTSGSTGQPKGVVVGHQGLTNIVLSCRELLGYSSGDTLLALTTISFDIAVNELFMPLAAGGVVELAEEGLGADGFGLAERLKASRPAYMQATPTTWKALVAADWPGDPDLCAISTGEALNRELAEALLVRSGALWNLYGPTETTVFSAYCRMDSDPAAPVKIGRPYPNTQLYVLDEALQPIPAGAVGELFIGGTGVAKGYWRKPALSESRFIPNPFKPGTRLYRTGDLARYLPNGELLWLGRIDHQVKIHGVRVELGEVESVLRRIAGIREAVVTSWIDARGDTQLVGHLMAEGTPPPSMPAIRAQLREQLPEAMVPPYLMFCDAFPLTANGKIHRSALPSPDGSRGSPLSVAASPNTPTEKLVAEIWAQVLDIDVDQIGRDHDFMDLGGHSLLMTPLMLAVRKRVSVSFTLGEFFGASTLQAFARLIDERRRARHGQQNGRLPSRSPRDAEYGRQRMAYLNREAQLPSHIAPARGMVYQPQSDMRTVLLTGATGFLGVYLASEILQTTDAELYCLVRPKRGEDGRQRIEGQMRHYDVWRDEETWQMAWRQRLHVIEGDVTLHRLGILDATYDALAEKVDGIIHSAAHVNFIYPYEALRATNVLGIHEVIRFAFQSRIKPVHYLSTAAIWPMGSGQTFLEKDSIEHGRLLNLGYDESKWVGERCLLNAAERGLPVARYRPGEVGGDSISGRCVIDHFLLAAVKGFVQFGAFPALDMFVDVAPVDYVAKAIVYLAFHRNPLGRAFHLTNSHRPHMSDSLNFLRGLGYRFDEIRFETLRDRLIHSEAFVRNALFPYQAVLQEMDDVSLQLPDYDARETLRELEGSGIECPPADEKLFGTYMRYLQAIGFMPDPAEAPIQERSYAV